MARQIKRRPLNSVHFTPRVRRLLYAAIKADLPYKRACEIVGVDINNFKYWMERGKEDKPYSPYTQFRRYIRRIEARKEKELLSVIDEIAVGKFKIREIEVGFSDKNGSTFKRKIKTAIPQWKAAAWRLERKYPETYYLNPIKDLQENTPEDIAKGIRDATLALQNSVPSYEEEIG